MLGDCGEPGEEGPPDGDAGWKVGLCDGAWSGFLGNNEIGGE